MTEQPRQDQGASHAESGLFARLREYEQRSLEHDVGERGRQQKISNWSGVAFRLGDFRLTCRIEQIEEVIAFPPYTALPGTKSWLLGIANVRGNLAPVADLGWYLFGTRTPVTARTRLVITRFQSRLAGLVVDEVFGQRHFHTDDLAAAEDWDDTPLSGLVGQVFPTSESVWGVLKLDSLEQRSDFMNGARET
ncbi:MAG: purine-binding chemotaxis protein CheW [Wenzhouxiangella sp.]|nr:MAG: purine-binding chemotaxis protein CheW [Wenzhouxiangella sp.]